MSAVTPSGVPLVPEDAFDWAMQDGVLTSPTCAVERVAAGMKAKFESELAKEKATMETKYAKRLENLEKKMEMTGIQDLTKASSVGEVKLTVNQIKAKLKGETVPTVLATMLMAMCAFGGVTVHKANINDLGDADVVTNVTYVSDGIDLSSVTNVAGSVTSNIVTKSYVEGLGVNTGHTDAQVKSLAGQKIDEKVTKQFVEGLGIEAQVPEANVRSAVSNVVTKSYVDSLGLDTMITATSVTNISSKVVSNVVTKAYVEDLGIEAGHTDDEIKALAGPVVTNIAPSLASNVVTKSYVENLNPDVGQHTDDEVKALAGPVVTNIAPSLVSNVVTKSYVEDLGISGGSADMSAVTSLVETLTADIPRTHVNNEFSSGTKIADVLYNGEERDIYIPSDLSPLASKGMTANAARRGQSSPASVYTTTHTGSQSYMRFMPGSFLWARTLDDIWVGGTADANGVVSGARRLGTEISSRISQEAPPPGNYLMVSNLAMKSIQTLQPSTNYTNTKIGEVNQTISTLSETIGAQTLEAVRANIGQIVSNTVITKAEYLMPPDGSRSMDSYGVIRYPDPSFLDTGFPGAYDVVSQTDVSNRLERLAYAGRFESSIPNFGPYAGGVKTTYFWKGPVVTSEVSGIAYEFKTELKLIKVQEFKTNNQTSSQAWWPTAAQPFKVDGTSYNYTITRRRAGVDNYGITGNSTFTFTGTSEIQSQNLPSYPTFTYWYGDSYIDGLRLLMTQDKTGSEGTSERVLFDDSFEMESVRYTEDEGSTAATSVTNLYECTDMSYMGKWEVYYAGKKMNGELVPDMSDAYDNSAWAWRYTGTDLPVDPSSGAACALTWLYFTGEQYLKYPQDNPGNIFEVCKYRDAYAWPPTVSWPGEGLHLSVYCVIGGSFSGSKPLDGITGNPWLPPGFGFEFVWKPCKYIRRRLVDTLARGSVEDARKPGSILNSSSEVDANANVLSVSDLGSDYIMAGGYRFDKLPDPILVQYYIGTFEAEVYKCQGRTNFFCRFTDSPESMNQWMYYPEGHSFSNDINTSTDPRDLRISGIKGASTSPIDANSFTFQVQEISPTTGRTNYESMVAMRYSASTNSVVPLMRDFGFVDRPLLRSVGEYMKPDGSVYTVSIPIPGTGDTVEWDGTVFTFDPVKTASWTYTQSGRTVTNYVFSSSTVTNFMFKYGRSYSDPTMKWYALRQGSSSRDWYGVHTDVVDYVVDQSLGASLMKVHGYCPTSPSSEKFSIARRTPSVVTNTVDKMVLRSSIGADVSTNGIRCVNSATGTSGVIKPVYNGTSVNWVWSEN